MPDTFGPYRVEDVVARGSTGTVYRTRHIELDREAAVKELSEEVRDVPGQIDRLRAEASILASMSHPHIVEVYDYVEDGAGAWIAEQWIDGGPIQAILDTHGTLEPEQALGVIRGAILGLAHAHDRDIVHRDISTSNILADMEGTSMLVDFGIAAPAGSGHALGTPAFLSPEAAAGLPVDKQSDVYSAAAVLYLLLTGSPVFGGTVAQVVESHLHDTAPVLTGHGAKLADLMKRSLAKSPGERPADAGAFLAELEAAAAARYGPEWLAGSSIAGLTGVFGPGRSVLALIGNSVGIGSGSVISASTVAAAVVAGVVLVAGAVGAVVLSQGDGGTPSARSTSSASQSPGVPSPTASAPEPDEPDESADPDDDVLDPDPELVPPRATDTPSTDDPSDPGGDDPGADPDPDPDPGSIAFNEERLNGNWTYAETIIASDINPAFVGVTSNFPAEFYASCETVETCSGDAVVRGFPFVWHRGVFTTQETNPAQHAPITPPGCTVTDSSYRRTQLIMYSPAGSNPRVASATFTGTYTVTYEATFDAPCPGASPLTETRSVTFSKDNP